MELVDVYVNRRPIGYAHMRDDQLEAALTPRGRPRTRLSDCALCEHAGIARAFAHRRARDEHWPILYCTHCFAIVAGLDPLIRGRRPRWKYDERNVAIARWTREWPKRGRPSRAAPPLETAWPDAA